ncbi:hypothetical protein O6H91_16G045100 [Diphasiastrum complanatum]|uniref:Uncharacterized protein n=1 Tax=Diphasiastrum complanatum TaxID=34168 RepID=A0ACC2BCW5_DIPCM|nr:hypothetical protein O6H91_16G045100 [Diphasiastrum complanatum]
MAPICTCSCSCALPSLSLPLLRQFQAEDTSLPSSRSQLLNNNSSNSLPTSYCGSRSTRPFRAVPSRSLGSWEDRSAIGFFGRRESFWVLGSLTILLGGDTTILSFPSFADEEKKKNLAIDDIKQIIENDIKIGQYYVTGKLTRNIYNNHCRFIDPTTNVEGLDKYIDAVTQLFDPKASKQQLLSIEVTSPKTIMAHWRLGGFLKFPWRPLIRPYEGTTRYGLDDQGLIISHDETWNISLLTAFLEFLTPSWMSESEEQFFQNFV